MGERSGIGKARARIKEKVDKVRAREQREQREQQEQQEPGQRDRFDKFTARARKVLTLAQEEAGRLNHNYIGTEHLLLGLIREGEGIAAKALASMDVDLERARGEVELIIGRGDRMVVGEIGLTPRAKRVIDLAVDEARILKHRYIGTEHLLLGIIREGEGIAAGVLEKLGVNLEQARTEVLGILGAADHTSKGGETKSNVVTCRLGDNDLDAVDALVEAGIRGTRSDAASWLIHAGIEANRPLLNRVYATVAEIHRLRAEAQDMAQQLVIGEASLATAPAAGAVEVDRGIAQPEGIQSDE